MRNLVVSLQVIWLLVWTYIIFFEGTGPSKYDLKDFLLMACIYVPPIVTLYYLYLVASDREGESLNREGESLFSLWLSVRKKKLKDELED